MKVFGKRSDDAERTIKLRTFPGNEKPVDEIIPVSELFMRDSLFRPSDWTGDHLPSLEEINRFLLSGSGDDGHFVHRWAPIELSPDEYDRLAKQFRKRQIED